jgi:hypothetical protein
MLSMTGVFTTYMSAGLPLWVKSPVRAFLSLVVALSTLLIGIGVGERLLDLWNIQTSTMVKESL